MANLPSDEPVRVDCGGSPLLEGGCYRIKRYQHPAYYEPRTVYHAAGCSHVDVPVNRARIVLTLTAVALAFLVGVLVGAKVTWGSLDAAHRTPAVGIEAQP